MTSDPFQILLRHFEWSTHVIIDASRSLSDAQLDQTFEMGLGTLRKTIDHLIWCVEGWCERLDSGRWAPEGGDTDSLDRLQQRLDAVCQRWQKLLAEHIAAGRLDEVLSFEATPAGGGRRRYRYARATIFVHMMTHGVHHRAQCLNMLRHLGVTNVPPIDCTSWQRCTELPPEDLT